jgi:hypothetical protein
MNLHTPNTENQILISNKRGRVMSDTSMYTDTNNDDESGLIPIKPVSKYSTTNDGVKPTSRKVSLNSETRLACNCKNSQCLKLYCECFSMMSNCDPKLCSCRNCLNNNDNEVDDY